MTVPTLVSLSTKACIQNIRSLDDVGDIGYEKIESILRRIESPEQLHEIETRSPQIKGEDAELWKKFIRRDIPDWGKKNYVPKNPTKWYEVYCRYRKEMLKELARSEEELKASMAALNKKKATNVSKIVESKTLPRLPMDPWMLKSNGGVLLGGRKKENGVIQRSSNSMAWNIGKGKLTTGKSVMDRARREARMISSMARVSVPTHKLKSKTGTVTRAPAAMVDEHRRRHLPDRLAPMIKVLSKKSTGSREESMGGPTLEERENRLRALTMKSQTHGVAKPTMVSSDDDDDTDDLFDENPAQTHTPTTAPSRFSHPSQPSMIKPHPRPALNSSRLSSTTSTPVSRPKSSSFVSSSTSRPKANPSNVVTSMVSKPVPSKPTQKPSDIISAMISRPRTESSTLAATHTSSGLSNLSHSPCTASQEDRSRMMKKRRPASDPFNHAASKKPRTK